MQIEFLYKDKDFKDGLKNIDFSGVVFSSKGVNGLNIFTCELKSESIDAAKTLSKIKKSILENVDEDKIFILTDGASEYYNKRLYPLFNRFERLLRKLVSVIAVSDKNTSAEEAARKLDRLDFGQIYNLLFVNADFCKKVFGELQKNNKLFSKKEALEIIRSSEENTLWQQLVGKSHKFVADNFLLIKECRNDVMHAHNVDYEKYKQAERLIKKAIEEVNSVLSKYLNVDGEAKIDLAQMASSFMDALNKLVQASTEMVFICHPL